MNEQIQNIKNREILKNRTCEVIGCQKNINIILRVNNGEKTFYLCEAHAKPLVYITTKVQRLYAEMFQPTPMNGKHPRRFVTFIEIPRQLLQKL